MKTQTVASLRFIFRVVVPVIWLLLIYHLILTNLFGPHLSGIKEWGSLGGKPPGGAVRFLEYGEDYVVVEATNGKAYRCEGYCGNGWLLVEFDQASPKPTWCAFQRVPLGAIAEAVHYCGDEYDYHYVIGQAGWVNGSAVTIKEPVIESALFSIALGGVFWALTVMAAKVFTRSFVCALRTEQAIYQLEKQQRIKSWNN